MTWRIGSLFAGVAGLDLGLHAAGVGETAWFSEYDKDASAVLAARFPGVPNHGDVTAIDWNSVEPVDVLVGGYPCQPFSFAGQRGGADDARHLWPHFARALRVLRPRYAVLENVAGHLSLGFDAVLGDLAEAGFDAVWTTLRASDVGAPHRRERLFVAAADAELPGHDWSSLGRGVGESEGEGRLLQLEGRAGASADASHGGWNGWPPRSESGVGGRNGLPTERAQSTGVATGASGAAADAGGAGAGWNGRGAPVAQEPAGRSQPGDADAPGVHRGAAADTDDLGRQGTITEPQRNNRRSNRSDAAAAGAGSLGVGGVGQNGRGQDGGGTPGGAVRCCEQPPAWGAYAAAIARWEHALGRAAPAPVDERGRLNAGFSEWMMGFPEGWVTDVLPRNPALRCIGNAVVPQVAAVVGRWLLEMAEAEAVSA